MVVLTKVTGFIYKNAKFFQFVTSVETIKNSGELPRPRWTWVLQPAQMKSLISLLIVYAKIVENAIEIYRYWKEKDIRVLGCRNTETNGCIFYRAGAIAQVSLLLLGNQKQHS